MTTFTLRASHELAARLSSAEMRSWLDDFVRMPRALPVDPGSGDGRVSLTLPESTVNSVADHCQCGISSALRRIAFERLGRRTKGQRSGYDVAAAPNPCHYGSPLRDTGSILDSSSAANPLPALVINAILWILVVGIWIFFRSRKNRNSGTT